MSQTVRLELVASKGVVTAALKNGVTLWSGFVPASGGTLSIEVPIEAIEPQAAKPRPKSPAVRAAGGSPTKAIMSLMEDGVPRTVQDIRKATRINKDDIHGHVQYLRRNKKLVWCGRATYQKAATAPVAK